MYLYDDEWVIGEGTVDETWRVVSVYKCDGCMRELDDQQGYVPDDLDDSLHWCPFCAFRLRKITADEFMGYRHWHGVGRDLEPVFSREGEIVFVPARERKRRDPLTVRAPDLSKAKRFAVLERDGFRCRYCGATPDAAELEVDHVKPRSEGGDNDAENLVTACNACNRGKAARPLRSAPRRRATK